MRRIYRSSLRPVVADLHRPKPRRGLYSSVIINTFMERLLSRYLQVGGVIRRQFGGLIVLGTHDLPSLPLPSSLPLLSLPLSVPPQALLIDYYHSQQVINLRSRRPKMETNNFCCLGSVRLTVPSWDFLDHHLRYITIRPLIELTPRKFVTNFGRARHPV